MEIYKYVDESRVEDILIHRTIRFTQPSCLNDPFDCVPAIIEEHPHDAVQRSISRITKELHGRGLNKQEIEKFKWRQIGKFASSNNGLFQISKDAVRKNFDTIGILSLSKTNHNILMWSHYANSHRGFVIEFDYSNEFFKQRENDRLDCGILKDVIYEIKRPVFDIPKKEVDKDVLFVKNENWSYEKEVRIIRELKNAFKSIPDPNGDIFLFTFDAAAIKSIIIGMNSRKSDIEMIKKILKSDISYSHIALRKSEISITDYKMDIKKTAIMNNIVFEYYLNPYLLIRKIILHRLHKTR
jgi:hypothetical protein